MTATARCSFSHAEFDPATTKYLKLFFTELMSSLSLSLSVPLFHCDANVVGRVNAQLVRARKLSARRRNKVC